MSAAVRSPESGRLWYGHNETVAISTDVRPFSAAARSGYVGAFFAGGLALSEALHRPLVLVLVCARSVR
jgi:hypothetical protein